MKQQTTFARSKMKGSSIFFKALSVSFFGAALSMGMSGCTQTTQTAVKAEQTSPLASESITRLSKQASPPTKRYGLALSKQVLVPLPAIIDADPPRSRIKLDIPVPVLVNYQPTNSGEWTTLKDGRELWRLRLYTLVGGEMMFRFDPINLPTGTELWAVPSRGFDVEGFTTNVATGNSSYWLPKVSDHEVTIELLLPQGMTKDIFGADVVGDPVGNQAGNNTGNQAELAITTIKVH